MQAIKYKVTIVVEVLSLETVPGLLSELSSELQSYNVSGILRKDDGDAIRWDTDNERVSF